MTDVSERRIAQRLSIPDLLGVEAFVVVLNNRLNGVMIGEEGLDDDPPEGVCSASATRNLGQELKRSLGCSKVWHVEPDIGGDYANQSNAREVVSFGNHLRADQDIHLARLERGQHTLYVAPLSGGVPIHSRRSGRLETGTDFFFQSLGARPQQSGVGISASPATLRRDFFESAVVAAKLMGARVIHQGDVAFGAAFGMSAVEAENLSGEASPIQKQHGLATLGEVSFDGLGERSRENAPVPTTRFLLPLHVHVDDLD